MQSTCFIHILLSLYYLTNLRYAATLLIETLYDATIRPLRPRKEVSFHNEGVFMPWHFSSNKYEWQSRYSLLSALIHCFTHNWLIEFHLSSTKPTLNHFFPLQVHVKPNEFWRIIISIGTLIISSLFLSYRILGICLC